MVQGKGSGLLLVASLVRCQYPEEMWSEGERERKMVRERGRWREKERERETGEGERCKDNTTSDFDLCILTSLLPSASGVVRTSLR